MPNSHKILITETFDDPLIWAMTRAWSGYHPATWRRFKHVEDERNRIAKLEQKHPRVFDALRAEAVYREGEPSYVARNRVLSMGWFQVNEDGTPCISCHQDTHWHRRCSLPWNHPLSFDNMTNYFPGLSEE